MKGFITFLLFISSLLPVHASYVERDGIWYGLIRNYAFVTCRNFDDGAGGYEGNIVIPSEIIDDGRTYTVMGVGESAFAGCDKLVSVQLPSTVRSIGTCAFLGCTSLQQVSLPSTVRSFGSFAFTACTSLRQIILPRHTQKLDTLTLYCCASVTSLVLHHRIRSVCQGALEHLPSMTNLYCFSSTPPVAEQGAFTPSDQQRCTLHVPSEALSMYRQSPVWSRFRRIVALTDSDYTAQNYQRGDVNDDGKVDADDLAILRRLIVSLPDDAAVRWAADINADGIVNAKDYVALAKIL